MMLQALAAYNRRANDLPYGYRRKPVSVVLRILTDPLGCEVIPLYQEGTDRDGGLRQVPRRETAVPDIKRTRADSPILGCDKPDYVLGRPKPVNRKKSESEQSYGERVAKELNNATRRHGLFVDQLKRYAAGSEPDARVLVTWYEAGMPGLSDQLDDPDSEIVKLLDAATAPWILLQVGSHEPIVNRDTARVFWAEEIQASKGGATGRCCLCGRSGDLVDTLPAMVPRRLVPGAAQEVALVSVNFVAAQRSALSASGLKSVPICADCANDAVQGFHQLADTKNHCWRRRDGSTATIWWTKEGLSDDLFAELNDPSPAVARWLNSVMVGGATEPVQSDRFYALTFSGNVARLVVRGWLDLPLAQARDSIARWFGDIETVAPGAGHQYPSLIGLACSAGTLAYADRAWREEPPEGSLNALLQTAISGAPPPPGLLPRAVSRARAEARYAQQQRDGQLSDRAHAVRRRAQCRLGLIRLVLNRNHLKENPMSPLLDEARESPAYLAGRLFAVRERLQFAASGNVNASIVDRYFSRASENPVMVEHALTTLEKQHLRALARSSDAKKKAAGVAIDRLLRELHSRMGPAPARLSDVQSAEWIAGYYQQCAHDVAQAHAKGEKDPTTTTTAEEDQS
jgi:CRISPR-associated protein Csd1